MEPYADDSVDGQHNSWRPSHILDFSDLTIGKSYLRDISQIHNPNAEISERVEEIAGDPICDLIPIYLDVFRGDADLLKKLLENYGLPLIRSRSSENGTTKTADSTRKKVLSPSYRTM